MKNELIVATRKEGPRLKAAQRLREVLTAVGLQEMASRFWLPADKEAEVVGSENLARQVAGGDGSILP